MHAHLDPVGGIAGDMFAAAMLDAFPALESGLRDALERAGLGAIVSVAREPHDDGVLTGSRFRVTPTHAEQHDHHHRHYREVVELLRGAELAEGVRARALAMFRLLGEAEADVHGTAIEQVSFHEVGAWDSIADVVSAAWLLESTQVASWSCASLPMGSGRVHTAHGELALPAPATTVLLQGFPLHDDGRPGERITPTGAAILRYLAPDFAPRRTPMRLLRSGSGFGTRRLEGMSNVLRVLVFEQHAGGLVRERIAQLAFEVDDQTPEDLAQGLERLRMLEAVLDVIQAPVYGKKGRVAMQIQVLARADALDEVLAACLDQTSTLGVRWQIVERASLARAIVEAHTGGERVRVKQVTRPDGAITRKAEMADLAAAGDTRAARERLRAAAESMPREARVGQVGSEHVGSEHLGSGRDGTGRDGTGRDGTGRDGRGHVGSGHVGPGRDQTGRARSGQGGSGHDRSTRDRSGHERSGQDQSGHDRSGQDQSGQDQSGQDQSGHDRSGQDRSGHDRSGHDRSGQDQSGQDGSMQGSPAPERAGHE